MQVSCKAGISLVMCEKQDMNVVTFEVVAGYNKLQLCKISW